MRPFYRARALCSSFCAAMMAIATAVPALAGTISGVRVDAMPSGGALVSVTFAGPPGTYHVVGTGTTETAVLFDNSATSPQLPPSVAGAGPVTSVSILQTGSSTSVALHLATSAPVSVRVAGNVVFINVAPTVPLPGAFGALPSVDAASVPGAGQVTEVVLLKYADVSEVAGILVANSTVASNDNFTPQQSSLGTNSFSGGSFGGVTGGFSQPAQAQNFGPSAFGQPQGLAQRLNDNIAIDRRLNAIILTGTPEMLAPIKQTIAKIDVPVTSVVLETQIVELDDTAARNIGIDFSPDGTGAIFEATTNSSTTGTGYQVRSGAYPTYGGNLSANLYAQVQAGNAKVIAKPRILAQSGQQASILTGDAIPIITNVVVAGGSAVTSQQVNYVNVGVNLQIEPRVSTDGYVTSHIYSEVSSVTGYLSGIPQISQRTASTIATVKDGEAFVIGGLLQDSEIRNLSKIPFIGDIPLLGLLFQHVSTTISQTNLYVVVTPHIVSQPGVSPALGPLAVPTSMPQLAPPPAPATAAPTAAPLVAPSGAPSARP